MAFYQQFCQMLQLKQNKRKGYTWTEGMYWLCRTCTACKSIHNYLTAFLFLKWFGVCTVCIATVLMGQIECQWCCINTLSIPLRICWINGLLMPHFHPFERNTCSSCSVISTLSGMLHASSLNILQQLVMHSLGIPIDSAMKSDTEGGRMSGALVMGTARGWASCISFFKREHSRRKAKIWLSESSLSTGWAQTCCKVSMSAIALQTPLLTQPVCDFHDEQIFKVCQNITQPQ